MANPFKPDDKVLTFRKGIEIEATVRTIWNHEVQVRTADGDLLWRTVKTIRSVTAQETDQPAETLQNPEPLAEVTQVEPAHGAQGPPMLAEPVIEEPIIEEPIAEEPITENLGQPIEPAPQQPETGAPKLKKRRKGILSKFIGSDFDS